MVDPLVIPAGSLRHQVTILSPAPTPDAYGQSTSWLPMLTTRASLEQITAKSMYQSGALSTAVSHKLRMRYPGPTYVIKPGYQVTYQTHTYKIVTVDNIQERNRVYELLLNEISGAN